jgi:hypothetical protein
MQKEIGASTGGSVIPVKLFPKIGFEQACFSLGFEPSVTVFCKVVFLTSPLRYDYVVE